MSWISAHFETDELAPEDVVAEKVHAILAADERNIEIFGADWIRRLPWVDPFDFDHFPQLLVTLFSTGETPSPGLRREDLAVYIVVRYERLSNLSMVAGEAGMATLLRHERRILEAAGNKLLNTVVEGQTVQLANRSAMGNLSFRADQDPKSGRFAYNQIMQWNYGVHVDPDTGRIRNVVLAGG